LHSRRPTRSLRTNRERLEWSKLRLASAAAVESQCHEVLLAFVIVANLIAFILETDARVTNECVQQWEALSRYVFLPIYTMDLCTRLYVYRTTFFQNRWNLMDAFLVISDALVEVVSLLQEDATSEVQVFSMLRGLRLCRLARFAKVMVIFKELHMMLHAFLSAMRTMFWACCMLAVLLTFCSILAVEFVHPVNVKLAERGVYGDCQRCERAFSTVMHANLTFVQQILAGDSWGKLSVPIIEEEPGVAIILISALLVINLGMLNLILTVIVNAASEARKNDKRLQADENLQKFEATEEMLVRICAELDVNEDGVLSLEELTDALDTNAEFRNICEALDMHKDDMQVIYAFLDANGDGMVTYAEFVEQAFKIRQLDTNSLLVALRGVVNRLSIEVQKEIRNLKHGLGSVSKDVRAIASSSISSLSSPRERFKSCEMEAEADDADCHVVHTSGLDEALFQSRAEVDEPREKNALRDVYWSEMQEELASLRLRLDADVAGFVAAALSKMDTHVALEALSDHGGTCLDSSRCFRRDDRGAGTDGTSPRPSPTALRSSQSTSTRKTASL